MDKESWKKVGEVYLQIMAKEEEEYSTKNLTKICLG